MTVTFTTDLPDVDELDLDGTDPESMTAVWSVATNNGWYRLQVRDDDPEGNHPNWGGHYEATTAFDDPPEDSFYALDGEQYSVRVRTETDYVTGEWLTAEEITKLFAPTDVGFVAVDDRSATIQWTDESEFDGSYQVYRARTDYEYGAEPGDLVGTVAEDAESYTDPDLSPGREYTYTVRARSQWVHADSDLATVTTDSVGLEQRPAPPLGWHVEVDHPERDAPIRPRILTDARRRPRVNDLPRIDIPVPHDETWHAESFDDAPLRVWHDGKREAADRLEHRRMHPDRDVLEGRGGTQLERRVIEDVDVEPTHEFIQRIVSEYTDYEAIVDHPESDQDDVVLQAAATALELQQALEDPPADSPVYIDEDGYIDVHDVAWVFEGEEVAGPTVDVDFFSGGEALSLQDLITYGSWTFTPDYDVENATLYYRYRVQGGDDFDNNGFRIHVNNELVEDVSANSIVGDLQWREGGLGNLSLEAGESYDIDVTVHEGGGSAVQLDVIAVVDEEYAKPVGDLDNEVHQSFGYLDDPQTKPDLARIELEPITTPLALTEVTLDVTTDDGTGAAELGIGIDGTQDYDVVTDALTHTLAYQELATTARARIGVGANDATRNDATPRTGFEATRIDSLELSGILDDTPVLTDRSFDDRLIDVLREVADIGDFVFEVRPGSGAGAGDDMVVEATQLGQRESDADPDLADYEIDRQTEDVVERAIIYGGAQRVTRQPITVLIDEWVDLPFDDARIVEGMETVYEGDDEFERGADYEIRYATADGTPQLKALSGGALEDDQTVRVDADIKPRGEFVAGHVVDEEDARTVIEDIPGLASKQMCDQVALYLVDRASEAITEAEITVPSDAVEWSVLEAIDPGALPGEGPYQTREIDHRDGETSIRLADRLSAREAIQEIRDRTQRVSERV